MSAAPRISLDHIAIAVPSLEEALEAFRRLLPAAATPPEEVPSEQVRLSLLSVGGARIEVLEPTSKESPVGRFLSGGRRGVHHLSFRIDGVEIDEWFEELKRRGVEVLGAGPTPGGAGARVFFVHPRSTGGVLIEFSQAGEAAP
jgi:methylmalonyl-CoA/ethylmalonyl-CoA epimerase